MDAWLSSKQLDEVRILDGILFIGGARILMRDRSMVGLDALNVAMLVRIQLSHLCNYELKVSN